MGARSSGSIAHQIRFTHGSIRKPYLERSCHYTGATPTLDAKVRTHLTLGASYAIAAAAALAGAAAMIKLAAADLPNVMVVWLRCVFGLLMLTPWIVRGGFGGLQTQRWRVHVLRAGSGVTAMYCFFFAISRLNLADSVLLNYSQPLFIPFIAWLWLSERPPARIYPAVFIGFVGVAFILKPSLELVSPGGLFGLASGLFAAIAMVCIRRMSDTEPALRVVVYFTVLASLISTLPALILWHTPSPHALLAMLAAGGFASLGQILLTRAYGLAPAAHIGSLVYVTVIFATLWGWIGWAEVPDAYSVFGASLVIMAGLLVVLVRRRGT